MPLRYPVSSVMEAPFLFNWRDDPDADHDNCTDRKLFWVRNNNKMKILSGEKLDLPTSKCEYVLAKQELGANATMGRTNTQGFFITVGYKGHVVRHDVESEKITIDGTVKNQDQFFVNLTKGFTVERLGNYFSVQAPGLRWGTALSMRWNRFARVKCGTGLIYDSNIRSSDTGNKLLSKFRPYLVDPNCSPV